MAKYDTLAELLKRRIQCGDYTLTGFPSERRLAEELGVSRMTARRAVQCLVDDAWLVRLENGRLEIPGASDERGMRQIAFLGPAFASPFMQHIRLAAERAGAHLGTHVRSVDFVHPDDPVIAETLENFDGVFVSGVTGAGGEALVDRVKQSSTPVVAVETDYSEQGVPSLVLFPPVCVQQLLNHLESLGHTTIGCLNTLPANSDVARRIEQWNLWRLAHGFHGDLIDEPCAYFESPMDKAYAVINAYCREGLLQDTALFVTSEIAAIGAMRALHDCGWQAGTDLSLCTLGGDGFYRYLTPSLTAVEMPNAEPFLTACVEYMLRGVGHWTGPLLMRPEALPLFAGESTRAPREANVTSERNNGP